MKPPTYHHLGLEGWTLGEDRPSDAVITFKRTSEPGVHNARGPSISFTVVWRDLKVSADYINTLLDQWPLGGDVGHYADVFWEIVR